MPKAIVISIIIIGIGVAWLLNALNIIGGTDWVWTCFLGAAGVLTLTWGKLNKLTFVMGCFLIAGALFSILRQIGALRPEVEVPILVVVFGLLFLIAQYPAIPHTPMVNEIIKEAKKQG